jgi:hypothetical protein
MDEFGFMVMNDSLTMYHSIIPSNLLQPTIQKPMMTSEEEKHWMICYFIPTKKIFMSPANNVNIPRNDATKSSLILYHHYYQFLPTCKASTAKGKREEEYNKLDQGGLGSMECNSFKVL